ncbi:uncharacterized protein Nmag_1639 [Natrialba magadii ATCC 43099]|uniref:Uncharacterized protein n=1 Tax=Natrialba magadii (strain ATCC 43099 / DSM 3394 / CCM 3739 / CIP 104546 / IAM 13178 / JCM 8861 / NBRC 102185 / NCIMB 2190 / MS3) TaxID=547559 RepID=D3SUF7_NATMM|nr:hypothetical protein [Natrialba magadii]ADD05215.1 uncharacterized protein Nmag_1639 [Natrialba magadii ATCC 43099]ELY23251.1 hypothetical protein C500_20716 [Natrialba magadii ATCC 43099]
MTGAGAATVAYTVESEYGDGPAADPTWIQPGTNITVGNLTVEQALQRSRHPDDPTPCGSRAGDFEGAASVSFTMTDDNFHDLIFADDGTALPNEPMRAPSSAWHFGADLLDEDASRTPTGTIVLDASVSYQRAEDITVDLTLAYGFEPDDVSTPESIEKPSCDDEYTWHGTELDVDGAAQTLMQTATLSLSNLARFRRGQSRHPFDAVASAIEPAFASDATVTETDQLEMAVGDGVDLESVDKVDGTLTFENGQGETIGYELVGMQPTSYDWSNLVNPDEDLSEPIDYHVADVEVVA